MKNITRVLALASVLAAACSNAEVNMDDGDEMVGSTAQAVTVADYTVPMTVLNGTYTGCAKHTNGEAWSIAMVPGAPLPNPTLRVKKNDAACVLTVTSATDNSATPVTFQAGPAIPLATSFAALASSFTPTGDPSKRFYGNAKADTLTFSTNFNILFVYSDKANDVASTKASTQYVSGSATSALVPASDMSLNLDDITTDTDSAGVVTAAAGNAQLNLLPGTIMGDEYVIVDGPLPTTWKALDDAFMAGSNFNGYQPANSRVAVTNGGNIPALFLINIGDTLPKTRVMIVSHLGQAGIRSYQTFTITFQP